MMIRRQHMRFAASIISCGLVMLAAGGAGCGDGTMGPVNGVGDGDLLPDTDPVADGDADVDGDASVDDPCDGVTCSGHGLCESNRGAARCECDTGYHAEGLVCVPDGADGDADSDADRDDCSPVCDGRECGPDGCGGTCGDGCTSDEVCAAGGECVPSCGASGGDTCTDRSTTLCDGLPELRSHDCELCCDRSLYPRPSAKSFHIVHIEDIFAWDSILEIVTAHDDPVIASQNKSPIVEYDRWAKNISVTWYASGEEMADAIHETLVPVGGAPIAVMIDELRSGSIELVGAWKWDLPYMSNTSRDLAFRESFEHYSVRGERTSRLGQVACE